MAARESQEGFVLRGAAGQIGLEQTLDGGRYIGRLDFTMDLARQRGVGPEAAAHQNVVALDLLAVLGLLHFASQQPDVADIVLRAGMMAAGQVDVDRRVELDARLAPARDLLGMTLGVGGGELAADVAGAGDQAGADRVGAGREPERLDGADRLPYYRRRDPRDEQVLPD